MYDYEKILKEVSDSISPLRERRDYGKSTESEKEAVIKKCPKKNLTDDRPVSEQQWCLFDSKGERLLGRHPSKQKALDHERAVQYFKHK